MLRRILYACIDYISDVNLTNLMKGRLKRILVLKLAFQGSTLKFLLLDLRCKEISTVYFARILYLRFVSKYSTRCSSLRIIAKIYVF